VQVGRHTFRLKGKVIGLEIVGRVETLLDGRPRKKLLASRRRSSHAMTCHRSQTPLRAAVGSPRWILRI
jgi:hypothetical protein